MPVIKLTLSEESYQKLLIMAGENSVQDYIRAVVFETPNIFTPEEDVRRVVEGDYDGKEFSLPDLYADQWPSERGMTGVFGKHFFRYISNHPELGIRFKDMGPYGRRAVYTYRKG